jgi:hypothetical protein
MMYRLRPVMVEAVQAIEGRMSLLPGVVRDCGREAWVIKTRDGDVEIAPGDWVVTGMANDHFVMHDDKFQMIYDPVEEAVPDG